MGLYIYNIFIIHFQIHSTLRGIMEMIFVTGIFHLATAIVIS